MGGASRPLYQQIKEYLLEEIDVGRLEIGDRVPSERDLAERFRISRMTVRHALTELSYEGFLSRQQGRGSFVARPKIPQRLTGLTSFTEDMLSRGMKPGARVLSIQVAAPGYKIRRTLNLKIDDPVVRIERLRLADGEPMALEVVHLPARRFPELEKVDLENRSLYTVLEERYGVTMASAVQTIEPAAADSAMAQVLAVREGTLLLLLERTTLDADHEPLEYVTSYYRGDRYRFVVELHRQ